MASLKFCPQSLAICVISYYTNLDYKEAEKIENAIDTVVNSKLSVDKIDEKDNRIAAVIG